MELIERPPVARPLCLLAKLCVSLCLCVCGAFRMWLKSKRSLHQVLFVVVVVVVVRPKLLFYAVKRRRRKLWQSNNNCSADDDHLSHGEWTQTEREERRVLSGRGRRVSGGGMFWRRRQKAETSFECAALNRIECDCISQAAHKSLLCVLSLCKWRRALDWIRDQERRKRAANVAWAFYFTNACKLSWAG